MTRSTSVSLVSAFVLGLLTFAACSDDDTTTNNSTTSQSTSTTATGGAGGETSNGGGGTGGATTSTMGSGGAGGQGGSAATGGSGGALPCDQLPKGQCIACCSAANPEGALLLFQAGIKCLCTPKACGMECKQACDAGMNVKASDITEACRTCMADKVKQGGNLQCATMVLLECNKSQKCKDYIACTKPCVL